MEQKRTYVLFGIFWSYTHGTLPSFLLIHNASQGKEGNAVPVTARTGFLG